MKRLVGLAVMLVGLGLTQAGAAIENRPPLLSPATTQGGVSIVGGTMNIVVVHGCYALITGDVQTPDLGFPVSAFINAWDDGVFLSGIQLDFAGDGTTQSYCHVYQQAVPVGQGAPGVGIFLADALGPATTTVFDGNDNVLLSDICTGPAPVCASSAIEVPAIDRSGFTLLALLLAAAALVWLARRRSASAES